MRNLRWVVPAVMMACFAVSAQAQLPGGLGRGLTQPGGMAANLTQMRERAMNNLKAQLEATDDEWKVLAPRIEKVVVLRVDSQGGLGGAIFFFRLPRGLVGILREAGILDGLGPFAALIDSPVTLAAEGIRDAVADENARGPDLAFHLQTYRRARDKARADLVLAQDDLRQLLTPRQEAFLIVNGLLD